MGAANLPSRLPVVTCSEQAVHHESSSRTSSWSSSSHGERILLQIDIALWDVKKKWEELFGLGQAIAAVDPSDLGSY